MVPRPVVAVIGGIDRNGRLTVSHMHLASVEKSGGVAVVFSPLTSVKDVLRVADAILLTEGPDVHPKFYGGDLTPSIRKVNVDRDKFELALVRKAIDAGIPVLGISRGAQAINVSLGGTLYQDISSEIPKAIKHDWDEDSVSPEQGVHTVRIKVDTLLYSLLKDTVTVMGTNEIFTEVNSFHHQAVKKLGDGLRASAHSIDGIPEAIESDDGMVLGVQWRPEYLPNMKPLFDHLIQTAVRSGRT